MDGRRATWAVGLAVLAGAGGVADIVLQLSEGAGRELIGENSTSGDVSAIGYGIAGAYLVRARPRNLIGWVLVAIALTQGLAGFANGYALLSPGEPLAGRTFAAWCASWVWFLGFGMIPTVLLVLYPTGHVEGRRRWLVAASLLGSLGVSLGLAFSDALDDIVPGLANPVASPLLSMVCLALGAALLVPCVVIAVIDAGHRLWRGQSPEREQLAWLMTTVILAVATSYIDILPLGGGLVLSLMVPAAVAVAVVRHRLLDLQIVVRRTLLFLTLTALVVLAFVVTTTALSPVLERGQMSVAVAAALVAVVLTPARDRLQQGVDRIVYGERSDPVRAAASVGRFVAEHGDEDPLPQVLHTVAAAVRSPYVALLDAEGRVVAETAATGLDSPLQLALPLHVGGRSIGRLVVDPRTARDGWSTADRGLLDLLAGQVALLADAGRLNRELAESRDRVLAATADERRRLHQEMHDGLGPALSGIALGLEAAEASDDHVRTAALLSRLRMETQRAGKEVRRLVEGLLPAALEGQGLVDALQDFIDGLAGTSQLDIALDLSAPIPAMGPQVDAAAYRIVTEAVTNVVRHSGATTCRVGIGVRDGCLTMRIHDDGSGLPARPREGVGLASMRRRAEELGGIWTASGDPDGGTLVQVSLPLAPLTASASASAT